MTARTAYPRLPALLALLTYMLLAPAFAQTVLEDFNPNANNDVETLTVQADGKLLVGGSFSEIGGAPRPGLARLLANGTLDQTYAGGTVIIGTVHSIVALPDGKVLIGGALTSVGGVVRNGIARLNVDGTLDTAFNPNAAANGSQGNVFRILRLASGKLLVGGHFINMGGSGRSKLVRLNTDGSVDTGFAAVTIPAGDYVWNFAEQADGRLLVSGGFQTVNGAARENVVRLNADGSLDSSFAIGVRLNSGANASTSVVLQQADGRIVISGQFDRARSTGQAWASAAIVGNLARFDANGVLDTSFTSNGAIANALVNWMALLPDQRLLIGGNFTSVDGVSRSKLARLLDNGAVDTSFAAPAITGSVWSLAAQADGRVVIGGNFTAVGTVMRNRIARFKDRAVMTGIAALSVGDAHTCALTSAGAARCWGYNKQGQVGDGTVNTRLMPVAVSGANGGVQVIAAASVHSCLVTTGGVAKCWGDDSDGQLGNGLGSSPVPVGVGGMESGIHAIRGDLSHTCSLSTMGAVQCWGTNNEGQLGSGTTQDNYLPAPVSGLSTGIQAITTGDFHTCALTTTGAVRCWGRNSYGELGDGTGVRRLTPTAVSGATNGVMAINAGGAHSCLLTTAGGVKCWGYNGYGQLGDGSTINRLMPVAVSGLGSGVQAISAGSGHTCALTTAGSVHCWGANSSGQIGDGTTVNRLTPVAVSGLGSGVQAIGAGWEHTCALTMAGTVQCWGMNYFGQLGNDTTIPSRVPTPVLIPIPDFIFGSGFDE